VADDIRTLSAELARDPSSLVYVQLCEGLRRKGHVQEALTVALHGLGRHPDHADGYDALARVHTDRGELPEAAGGVGARARHRPEHTGALKGLGFLFWRQERFARRSTRSSTRGPRPRATTRSVARWRW